MKCPECDEKLVEVDNQILNDYNSPFPLKYIVKEFKCIKNECSLKDRRILVCT